MISTQMIIWLAIVAFASVGMLLGIFALTHRIEAIDERLFELRQLEIALSRDQQRLRIGGLR
jgi:cytochrome c-type biogenesis protein CcmE